MHYTHIHTALVVSVVVVVAVVVVVVVVVVWTAMFLTGYSDYLTGFREQLLPPCNIDATATCKMSSAITETCTGSKTQAKHPHHK